MIYINTSERWNKMRLSSLFFENRIINSDFKVQRAFKFYFGSIVPKKEYELTNDLINTYKKYVIVKPGDIIINGLNLNYDFVTQRVGLAKELGIITSAYICLRSRSSINSKYYCYLFKTIDAHKMFHGLGSGIRLTLSFNDIKNFQIPVPPRSEQDQIVKFLDWKVSFINKLINIKQRQINNFNEKLLVDINHLITHGIRLHSDYIKTEIDWAPIIPSNWTVSRIRNHFEIQKRIAGTEGFDVFSVTQQGLKVRDINLCEGQLATNYSGYQFVYPGEFAMNHMDLLTGGVGIADHLGVTSPDYRVFKLIDDNHCYAPYFLKVFQVCYRRHAFYRFGRGAANVGRWRLPATAFKNFEIPIPPFEEQIEIVNVIDKKEDAIKTAIESFKHQVVVLQEFKTRLIADVVTGKIDVRNIEIPEYEFVEEENDSIVADSENEEGMEE